MFDPSDQGSEPMFVQFGLGATELALEGGASSPIGSLPCGRVLGIGSPSLIRFIEANLDSASYDSASLVEGVAFFQEPLGDDEPTEPSPEGTAPAFEAQLGVDFPCNALLIVRLEIDDQGPSPYRVDFELIPSESNR
jgi:hypothetical protein